MKQQVGIADHHLVARLERIFVRIDAHLLTSGLNAHQNDVSGPFQFTEGARCRGRVLDADGEPLANAFVYRGRLTDLFDARYGGASSVVLAFIL